MEFKLVITKIWNGYEFLAKAQQLNEISPIFLSPHDVKGLIFVYFTENFKIQIDKPKKIY